jgi:hypothetical protein
MNVGGAAAYTNAISSGVKDRKRSGKEVNRKCLFLRRILWTKEEIKRQHKVHLKIMSVEKKDVGTIDGTR